MGYQGTIDVGLRAYPYALPNVPVLTATGGIPPAFNQQDFYCSLKTVHKVDGTDYPIHDASYILSPQGIIATELDPSTPGGNTLTDAAMIGDYLMYFPNQVTGSFPAVRPIYVIRRNLFNVPTPGAGAVQRSRIEAPGNYFANSGQKPFAMNPYRFALQGAVRLAGKAALAHAFEDTAGPDNINPTYIFNNAPLSFKVPLEVDLPGTDILAGYSMMGCPYGDWDMVFLDKSTAPLGVYRKQLNWYSARGFSGETVRHESVLNIFSDQPVLHAIWSQNTAGSTATYRVNIWPYGWTVLFYTNGTGPNGPFQKFELAVMDPFMENYALIRFNAQDATAQTILANWVNGSGDVKLDDQGLYWLHNGSVTNNLSVITSFGVSPFDYPRIAPIQLPPVTMPCYAPCGPFMIPN